MAMHQAAILFTLVSIEVRRHPEIIWTKPGEFAVLLNAMVAALRALDGVDVQVLDLIRAQDEARASSPTTS
jgi:Lhr-like helicase